MEKQQKLPIFSVHLTPNQLSSKTSFLTDSLSEPRGQLLSGSCHSFSLRKQMNCLSPVQNGNRSIVYYYYTTFFPYLLIFLKLLISTSKLHFFPQPHTESSSLTLKWMFPLLYFSSNHIALDVVIYMQHCYVSRKLPNHQQSLSSFQKTLR